MAFTETLEMLIRADPSQGIQALDRFSTKAEETVSKSTSQFAKLSASALKIGAAGVGIGGFLTQMASGDIEAANQLQAAIGQTGHTIDEYRERIDAAVSSQVRFGHTDEEVKNALTTLTLSYNDTGKALDEMQLTADLAARKHISLGEAATIVAKAHGGAGRVFKEFGITVGENADGTKNYDGALSDLAEKLKGQAAASADTFGGRLKALGAEAENLISDFGQKFGPAILGVSTGLTALGAIGSGVSAIMRALGIGVEATTAATAENTVANTANAVSKELVVGSTEHLAAVEAAFVIEQEAATASTLAFVSVATLGIGAILAIGAATGQFGSTLDDVTPNLDNYKKALGAALDAGAVRPFESVVKSVSDALGDSKLSGAFQRAGITADGFTTALREGNTAFFDHLQGSTKDRIAIAELAVTTQEAAKAELDRLVLTDRISQAQEDNAIAATKSANGVANYFGALQQLANTNGIAAPSVDAVTLSVEEQKKQMEAASKAADGFAGFIDDLASAMDRSYQSLVNPIKLDSTYHASLDDLTKALQDNGTALDAHTEKGRSNIDAALKAGDSIVKLIEQRFKETHSVKEATDAGTLYIINLANQLRQAGYTQGQIQSLIATMHLTPEDIKTVFSNNALEQQIVIAKYTSQLNDIKDVRVRNEIEAAIKDGEFDRANRMLNNLAAGRTAYIDVEVRANGQVFFTDIKTGQVTSEIDIAARNIGTKATGGAVNAYGMYQVNEAGTELLTQGGRDYLLMGSQPGTITPAGQFGGTHTTYVTINMPPGSNGDDVVAAIKKYEQRNGAGWRN